METKIIAWFSKHFGHIFSGRNDTAEHGRAVTAYNELLDLLKIVEAKVEAVKQKVETEIKKDEKEAPVSVSVVEPVVETPVVSIAPVAEVVAPVIEPVNVPAEVPQEQVAPVDLTAKDVDNNPSNENTSSNS